MGRGSRTELGGGGGLPGEPACERREWPTSFWPLTLSIQDRQERAGWEWPWVWVEKAWVAGIWVGQRRWTPRKEQIFQPLGMWVLDVDQD